MEYSEANRPQNQKTVRGVIINPLLRDDFDNTPNDSRPDLEIEDWRGLPYVVGEGDIWHVRCLDGGAWDRSSFKGFSETMDGAIDQVIQLYGD